MSAEPVLSVRHLSVEFHTDDGVVHAVDGVSYVVDSGEAMGIVGEIIANRAGHAMHSRFVEKILRATALDEQPEGLAAGEAVGSFA